MNLNESKNQIKKDITKKNTTETLLNQKNISEKIKKIEKNIHHLKKEKKNIFLRHLANIENIKKENILIIKKIKKEISEKFFKKILPIVNTINEIYNSNKSSNISNHSIIEGIRITKNEFKKILISWNIKKINQTNQEFNKNIHIKNNKIDCNIKEKEYVSAIITPGYIRKDRVLQKAIVNIKNKKL